MSSVRAGTVSRASMHCCVLEGLPAEGARVDGNPAPLHSPIVCPGAGCVYPRGHLFLICTEVHMGSVWTSSHLSRTGPRGVPCNLESLMKEILPQ